jgi:hypothetical protein
VTLVAVTKTHPPAAIERLFELGHRDFGASYVQEWEEKRAALPARVRDEIRWHFIGHLQSNKARDVVDRVALVHSVDRASLIRQLDRRSERPVDVLVQVDLVGESSKSGARPDELVEVLDRVVERESLRPRGLMTLPPYAEDPEENRAHFERLAGLLEVQRARLRAEVGDELAEGFCELSMGMSHDFAVAIEEGATIVRLGTALFGPRHYDD